MKLNKFIIIVPFYNVEEWIEKCIKSIILQNYKNFVCVIVDDVSNDNSSKIVENIVKQDDRFIFIKNKNKKYALQNIVDGIEIAKPNEEDIIVTLDGDDWFASKKVLDILNEKYQKDILMTYGSYIQYPNFENGKFSKKIPDYIIENNLFRESEWMSSHLRTFKYKLWNKIDDKDLRDEYQNYFKVSWDMAFMFPMLEMSNKKFKYFYKYSLVKILIPSFPTKKQKLLDVLLQINTKQE